MRQLALFVFFATSLTSAVAVAEPPEADEGAAQDVVDDGEPAMDEGEAVEGEGDAEEVDPKVYAAYIREIVRSKREVVEETITDKVLDKQIERMGVVSQIVSALAFLGFGLLAMPLLLRKRYPGKGPILWKYSAVAALLFFVTVNLFAGVLSVLRFGQMIGGGLTNPQVQIVSATFDVIDEQAEELAPMGPVLIEPTLASLDASSDDPMPVMLLDNVSRFGNELSIFATVGKFFKRLDWVFGYLPVILSLVTVVIFVLGLRTTLTDIVRLPIRAAEGEKGIAREVTVKTLRRVGRELVATIAIMFVLLVVMIVAGLLLAETLGPALEAFIAYLGVAFIYVQVVPDASSAAVLIALGGTIMFLVLDLAVVLVAAAMYIGKAHKIFQRRFHDKEPLRTHGRFWKWGTACALYVLAFPLLFIFIAQPIVEKVIEWQTAGEDISWGMLLIVGPVLLVVMFLGAMFAARVHKAIGFIAKTKVPKIGAGLGTGLGADVPVRTGATAPHATVEPDAPAPDPSLAAAAYDEETPLPDVPVVTGLTQAHPVVPPAKREPLKTTRYGVVDK